MNAFPHGKAHERVRITVTEAMPGYHHITAICSDAQRNVDFYTGTLGLRLVKQTVNFDMPETYHLYYGDAVGSPGTILTFFAWPGAPRGRQGAGQAAVMALTIPTASLGYWVERLVGQGVPFEGPARRFEEQVLALRDPDGLALELVTADGGGPAAPWPGQPVPPEHAIRGLHSAALWSARPEATIRLLLDPFGFRHLAEADGRVRYATGAGGAGAVVDVVSAAGFPEGQVAVGAVHHIAWRARDDAEQAAWQRAVAERGLGVTPVQDRKYFRSIYFREPGGVLFEIATDEPGFAVDEAPDRLGSALQLPPWLEPRRAAIEANLTPLHVPAPSR